MADGNKQKVLLLAKNPDGENTFLLVDANGKLVTTGAGGGVIDFLTADGDKQKVLLLAKNPDGENAYLLVDADGKLITTGGGGSGLDSLTANLPITYSGTLTDPILGWDTAEADILNRQLKNADGQIVFEWEPFLRSTVSIQPDLPDTPSTTNLCYLNLQVDPLDSTVNQSFAALAGQVAIDPNNSGFAVQQAVGLDMQIQHRNAQGALGLAQVGRFFANLGDPSLTGGTLEQLEIVNAYAYIDQGYSIQNFYGMTVNQFWEPGSQMHGYGNVVQISSNPMYQQTGVNNIHGIDIYAQLYSDVAQGVNLFTGQFNVYGSSSYFVEAQFGSTFRNVSTTPDYKGVNISPSFEAGSTNGNLVFLNILPNSSIAANSVAGLNINLDSVTSAVGFNGNARNIAINASGGVLGCYVETTTQSGVFFDTINSIIPSLTIELGSPITGTEVLMHGFISLIQALDDYAAGPLGFGIGKVISGGQLSVASGKTIETTTDFLAGTSIIPQAGDGGTLTNHYAFRTEGLLAFGGNLVVTNFYGFHQSANATAGFSIPNAWGVHIADANAENFLQKSLVVGGTSGKVDDAGYAIQIADKKALKFTPMTTSERDALFPTPAKGTQIFNDTTNTLQVWDGSAWI
jgi:hypothetical protein